MCHYMLTENKLNCLDNFGKYLKSINETNISSFWQSLQNFHEVDEILEGDYENNDR